MNNKTKYSIIALTTIGVSAVGFMVYTRNSRVKLYKELISNLETKGTGKEIAVTQDEALTTSYWKKYDTPQNKLIRDTKVIDFYAKYFHKLLVEDYIISTDNVVSAINKMPSKAILSQISSRYTTTYKRSLADDLTHVGWLFISKDAVPKAIANLPNTILSGKK